MLLTKFDKQNQGPERTSRTEKRPPRSLVPSPPWEKDNTQALDESQLIGEAVQ